MKIINYIRSFFLCLIFISTLSAQTPINDKEFQKDIEFLIKDATTGFENSKGQYIDNTVLGRRYSAAYKIFGTGKAGVTYNEERYDKYSNKTEPQTYYFSQNFDTAQPDGVFVKANAERIFDELALTLGLKKQVEKRKKADRERIRSVEYLNKNGDRILYLYEFIPDNSITLQVNSNLKPSDLPNYLGCLILYNMQSEKIVGASALYVYGKEIESEPRLYSNVVSKIRQSYALNYSKFTYYPKAKARDIEARLDPLNVNYSIGNINPEGYAIP